MSVYKRSSEIFLVDGEIEIRNVRDEEIDLVLHNGVYYSIHSVGKTMKGIMLNLTEESNLIEKVESDGLCFSKWDLIYSVHKINDSEYKIGTVNYVTSGRYIEYSDFSDLLNKIVSSNREKLENDFNVAKDRLEMISFIEEKVSGN